MHESIRKLVRSDVAHVSNSRHVQGVGGVAYPRFIIAGIFEELLRAPKTSKSMKLVKRLPVTCRYRSDHWGNYISGHEVRVKVDLCVQGRRSIG